jgi:hypothetical protein
MQAKSKFTQVFEDLVRRFDLDKFKYSEKSFQELVKNCCKELEWPQEAADCALEQAAHLWRILEANGTQNVHSKKQKQNHKDLINKVMLNMETKDYLLIALVLAAAGYAFYQLKRSHFDVQKEKPASEITRWILVLVINARQSHIINTLKSGKIADVKSDELYQVTQSLWLGTEASFQSSELSKWFSEKPAVSEDSEYDVYLVRAELSSDETGFHRNANQMDRIDAFRNLHSKCSKTIISSRLPSESYATDVYTR